MDDTREIGPGVTFLVTLTCGHAFNVYADDERAILAGFKVGDWHCCVADETHSPPVMWDSEDGSVRKWERNQRAVSVERVTA